MKIPSKNNYKRTLSVNKWKASHLYCQKHIPKISRKDPIFKFDIDLFCYDKNLEKTRMVKFKELYYNDNLIVGLTSFNNNMVKFYELKLITNIVEYSGTNYKSMLHVVIRKIISQKNDYVPFLIEGSSND